MIPKKQHKRRKTWGYIEVEYSDPNQLVIDRIKVKIKHAVYENADFDKILKSNCSRFYVRDLPAFSRHLFDYAIAKGLDIIIGNTLFFAVKMGRKRVTFIDIEKFFSDDLSYDQLKEIIDFFWKHFKIDIVRYSTPPGIAINLFRSKFQEKGINNPFHQKKKNKNLDVEQRVQSSLIGGRCEIFKLGEQKDVYYLDFNSFYPYIYTLPLPTNYVGTIKVRGSDLRSFFKNLGDNRIALVTGHFHVERCHIPPVPKKTDFLYFPIGCVSSTVRYKQVTTSWWQYELSHDNVKPMADEIYIADVFTVKPFLKEFALDLYEIKKQADEKTEDFFKVLLNSLWGKLAQKTEMTEIYFKKGDIFSSDDPVVSTWEKGTFFERTIRRLKHYRLPHVASAVTSLGRALLLHALEKAEREIVYCDTDGFVVTKRGLNAYKDDIANELGKLKIKKKYVRFRAFRGRLYFAEDEDGMLDIKASGYPHGQIEQMLERIQSDRFDDIFIALQKVVTRRHLTIKEAIKFRKNPFRERILKYRHKKVYNKRKRLPNGETEPHFFACQFKKNE